VTAGGEHNPPTGEDLTAPPPDRDRVLFQVDVEKLARVFVEMAVRQAQEEMERERHQHKE
jgi:hypothetical protein